MTKMERPWASTELRDLLHFLYRVVRGKWFSFPLDLKAGSAKTSLIRSEERASLSRGKAASFFLRESVFKHNPSFILIQSG